MRPGGLDALPTTPDGVENQVDIYYHLQRMIRYASKSLCIVSIA